MQKIRFKAKLGRKGTGFKTLLMMAIIFSIIGMGCLSYLSGLYGGYGGSIDTHGLDVEYFNKTMVAQEELAQNVNNTMMSLTFTSGGTVSTYLWPFEMIRLGWSMIVMILASIGNSLSIIGMLATSLSEMLGIPGWIQAAIISLFLCWLIYMILALFLKWNMED